MNSIEPIINARTVKVTLRQAYVFLCKKEYKKAKQQLNQLNHATVSKRLVIKPVNKTALPILGWKHDTPDLGAHIRAFVVDPPHRFYGQTFDLDNNITHIILRAGNTDSSPWCQLVFSNENSEPSFELAVLNKDEPAHTAVFM